jgi:hypothetical protein
MSEQGFELVVTASGSVTDKDGNPVHNEPAEPELEQDEE